MQIIHRVDSFLYRLFDTKNGDKIALLNKISNYYTLNGVLPIVSEENNLITVSLDIVRFYSDSFKYNKLIKLCEQNRFVEGYPIVLELLENKKNDSELYRIKGQIESELGETDRAIDSLVDALRWDPTNTFAMLMMGNIFARNKDDLETAMKYYDHALLSNPNDNITLNNIGGNLMMMGNLTEAKKYFEKAQEIDESYPNSSFGLAHIAYKEDDLYGAFQWILKSLQHNKYKDTLYNQSIDLAKSIAHKLSDSNAVASAMEKYATKLESFTSKKINVQKDENIPTIAKVELAESYGRDYHLIKYKSGNVGVSHLIMHELTHIELAQEARLAEVNMLFIAKKENRQKFIVHYKKYAETLQKKGYSETSVASVLNSLYDGLNRQVFNTPIDLFIEDKVFNDFPIFRPIQFISLYNLLVEGAEAVTRKEIVELTDPTIISKSKIYNLLNALHFRNLYGIDTTKSFKSTPIELQRAESMYDEYLEYRGDRQPGEEYELVQNWANDLALYQYFTLVAEQDFQKDVNSILKDTQHFESSNDNEANQKIEMRKFLEKHRNEKINPTVVMFMIDALTFFKRKNQDEIRQIAFQIAQLGLNGIDPAKKKGYHVPLIEKSNFTGYQMLAYYYVSFALSAPQLLSDLELPFDKEYEIATQAYN